MSDITDIHTSNEGWGSVLLSSKQGSNDILYNMNIVYIVGGKQFCFWGDNDVLQPKYDILVCIC